MAAASGSHDPVTPAGHQPTTTAISFGFHRKTIFHEPEEDSGLLPKLGLPGSGDYLPIALDCHIGLGKGLGAQLTRSSMGSTAYTPLDPIERARNLRYEPSPKIMRTRKVIRLSDGISDNGQLSCTPRQYAKRAEPRDMFKQLLLSDLAWAKEPTAAEDLAAVRDHRWVFSGAVEMAQRGQSDCFFIRCLLDMQQNVQCEEEGDALDPKLVQACKHFIVGQCGGGRNGEMYQLLTHFVSNAVIFDEWDKYLKNAFANERANQESFLVPHLEQVWFRFQRMLPALEEIFDVLNDRFIWRHRLPKVGDVVRESMKRRCFSSKKVATNEMFTQEKYNNETVKKIKRCFRLGVM